MRKRQLVIALSSILGSGALLMSSAQAQAVEDWHGQSGNGPFSVVFDGNVYTNRWWVEGSHCPKNASAVNWSNAWQLDRKASSQEITASGNPTDCSAASTGTTPASPGGSANAVEQQQLTGSHKKGDVITFNEKSYVAKRDTQGVFVPGEKSVWQKYSKPVLWEADTTYTAGDHVIYRGQVYLAQWWVKGKIPTENLGNGSNGKVWLPKPHFVFLDTSKVDGYDSGVIYRKGDAARYQSTVYLVLKDIGVEGITPETSNPWKRYIDWTGVSDKVGESTNPWPKHTFAPYVDASLMSVPDFKSYMKDTGTKHFILAFLVNAGGGGCYYAWGGVSDVKDGPAGLYHSIKSLRKAGGDVLISIGGANNSPLAAVCEDVDELKVQYRDILNNFNLKALDFDIEGGHVSDAAAIERRSSALRMLQDELRQKGENVPVWFTLPVLPNGLTHDGIKVIESAVEHGVELAGVNLMTMDYGGSMGCQSVAKVGDRQRSRLDPTRNINGECAISASESVHSQLKKIYSDNHQDVSDTALWRMIGITPMIGVNDQELEVFFPADAKAVRSHGVKKGVGILSMWSVGRDTPPPAIQSWQVSPSHSGLPKQEAESRKFSRVLAKYDTLVDEAGTGSEASNITALSLQKADLISETTPVVASSAALKSEPIINNDTTPDQFRFPPLNRTFDPGSYVSYAITVRGIDAKSPVSVKAGDFSINGGSYTKVQGWVNNGDKVSLRIKSSHEAGKSVSSTLTIGGVSGVFSITTKATTNKPPVAQAGADKSVTEGTRVTLNGNGSSDSDGSIKRYVWKEGIKKLSTSKKFSKVFGIGTHSITLAVTDDKGAKSSDKVKITVKEKANKPPVAKAGADQSVTEGIRVTLNGNGSSDSDGSIKRYVWKEGTKKLSTSKKFSKVFGIGTHNIILKVTDDKGVNSRDKVKITVKEKANKPPVAKAGPDQTVTQGTRVTLNGSGSSDSDGSIKRYEWKEGAKTLSTSKKFSKAFGIGKHSITLKVTDDKGGKASDNVNVTVKPKDTTKPVIKLRGSDIVTLIVGDTYKELGAEATDNADGKINVSVTSKVDTDKVGGYTVKYTAKDKAGNTASISRRVIVKAEEIIVSPGETKNKPPVANAGPDHRIDKDEIIVFDGRSSYDEDGKIVSYRWKVEGANDISQPSGKRARFGHAFSKAGRYEVILMVTDDRGATASDKAIVNVTDIINSRDSVDANNKKNPPVAQIRVVPKEVREGERVTFDGSGSREGGSSIKRYEWVERGKTLSTSAKFSQVFAVGRHDIGLIVEDENGRKGNTSVSFRVMDKQNKKPVARAGADQRIEYYETTMLDGSKSSDEDGSIIYYRWTGEDGESSKSSVDYRKILAVGVHNMTLTVTDDKGAKDSDTVTVTVNSRPAPVINVSPDAFSFKSKTGVERGEYIYSDTIKITGLDKGVEAVTTVTNGSLGIYAKVNKTFDSKKGSYAENLKWCQAQPGFVEYKYTCEYIENMFIELPKPYALRSGLTVQLRIRSSDQPNTTTSATLKVGTESAVFSVTTK